MILFTHQSNGNLVDNRPMQGDILRGFIATKPTAYRLNLAGGSSKPFFYSQGLSLEMIPLRKGSKNENL